MTSYWHPFEGLVYFPFALGQIARKDFMKNIDFTIGHSTHSIDRFIKTFKRKDRISS